MAELSEVFVVKALHRDSILKMPNVVGLGTGYKIANGQKTRDLCVITLVTHKLPKTALASSAIVPKMLGGIPTDVVAVGEIRALASPTERWRPAPGGVSIGHYQITAGTLGCIVRDRATNARLILSNNHVLANSNDGAVGDPILQPGPVDGGVTSTDTIAHLERFVEIKYGSQPGVCNIANNLASMANDLARLVGSKHQLQSVRVDAAATNQVDAAVARPVSDGDVLNDILNIGTVSGWVPVELGMPLRKSGRTTGLTSGEVVVLDATVTVGYDAGRQATFDNQIVAGPISKGGDSGSLVVTGDPPKAVGLLFAGSDQSTILNPIDLVLAQLSIVI
jgi:hypothetical protein